MFLLTQRSRSRHRRARLLASAAVLAWGLAGTGAHAQATFPSFTGGEADAAGEDQDSRMLLEADSLVYDYDNDQASAVGNVEIYYRGYAVEAAEVVYDQKSQRVYARGGVKLTEPDGNVLYADSLEMTDDFREGFLQELTLVTPDRTRFAAATAERQDDEVTIFNRGVYTACEPCKENPDRAPIWQVKAKRIIHDQKEKVVHYEDASFEAFGVPIAYLPYFSHADPTVKRKSGFLAPQFRYSSETGFGAGIPYYFALAPNYDLTVTGTGYTKQGFLGEALWRHRLTNGIYQVQGAYIDQVDPDAFDTYQSQREGRGYLATEGFFDINEFWQWGFKGHLLTDSRVIEDYDLSGESEFEDTLFLTGLSARNYFDARIINYQTLDDFRPTEHDPDEEIPLVHPVVDYNYIFDDPVAGGQLSFNSSFLSLTRDRADFIRATANTRCDLDNETISGTDALAATPANCRLLGVPGTTTRFVSSAEWERNITTSAGQVFTPFASLRGDVYALDVDDPYITDDENDLPISASVIDNFINAEDEVVFRGMATAGLEGRWPILVSSRWGYQVFEPVAQLIARPDAQNNYVTATGLTRWADGETQVPNEDAMSFVFDDTTLFERDKFSGYDLMEGGTRLNAGVRYSLNTNWGVTASGLVGQSYHLAGDNPFPVGSGLASDRSDYVGAFYVSPYQNIELGTRVRLDEDDLELMRQDFQVRASYSRISATGIYSEIAPDIEAGVLDRRREIQGDATFSLTPEWSVFGGARYELEGPVDPVTGEGAPQWVGQSLGIAYEDECVAFAIEYERDFVRDGDIEPSESISFSIKLRTITEVGASTSLSSGDDS